MWVSLAMDKKLASLKCWRKIKNMKELYWRENIMGLVFSRLSRLSMRGIFVKVWNMEEENSTLKNIQSWDKETFSMETILKNPFNLRNPQQILTNFMNILIRTALSKHKICQNSPIHSISKRRKAKNLVESGRINTTVPYFRALLKMTLCHAIKDHLYLWRKIKANYQSFRLSMSEDDVIIENDQHLILFVSFILIPFHHKFDIGH